VPESTIERDDNLYVDETAIPEVWIICGEHDSTVNKNVYVYDILLLPIPFFRTDNGPFKSIKKKPEFGIPPPPPIARKYWNLENPSPGTQVFIQDGLKPGGA
jgi:hypothetical protein